MPEETTPEQVEETTPESRPSTTPDKGSARPETPESSPTDAPESSSPEELEQLQKRLKDQEAEITRNRQAEAELRRISEERERQIRALTGQIEQQQDPLDLIDAQIDNTWDEDEKRKLRRQRDQLLTQRAVDQATQRAMQLLTLKEGVTRAKQRFGYDESNLNETLQSLANDPELIAVARAYRDGTLFDRLSAEREEAKQAAEDARLHGSEMGGRARGRPPTSKETKDPHPPAMTFLSWTPRKQEAHVKEHGLPPGIVAVEDEDE